MAAAAWPSSSQYFPHMTFACASPWREAPRLSLLHPQGSEQDEVLSTQLTMQPSTLHDTGVSVPFGPCL